MTKKLGSMARILSAVLVLACLIMMLPVSAASEALNDVAVGQEKHEKVNDEIVDSESENENEEDRQGESCLTVAYGSWFVNSPYVFFSGSIYVTLSNGTSIAIPVTEQTSGNFPTSGVASVRFYGHVDNWHSSYGNNFNFSFRKYADVDFTIYMFVMSRQPDGSAPECVE